VSALELELVLGHLDRWCRFAPSLLTNRGEQDSDVPAIRLRGHRVGRRGEHRVILPVH
jgi:hypothetical protein